MSLASLVSFRLLQRKSSSVVEVESRLLASTLVENFDALLAKDATSKQRPSHCLKLLKVVNRLLTVATKNEARCEIGSLVIPANFLETMINDFCHPSFPRSTDISDAVIPLSCFCSYDSDSTVNVISWVLEHFKDRDSLSKTLSLDRVQSWLEWLFAGISKNESLLQKYRSADNESMMWKLLGCGRFLNKYSESTETLSSRWNLNRILFAILDLDCLAQGMKENKKLKKCLKSLESIINNQASDIPDTSSRKELLKFSALSSLCVLKVCPETVTNLSDNCRSLVNQLVLLDESAMDIDN